MRSLVALVLIAACNSSQQPAGNGGGGDDVATPDAPAGDPTDGAVTARCADKQMQPRDATWTITAGGATRKAEVHIPASYDPTVATPLVLNIHGRTQNGSQQAAMSHAVAKSDAAGFILVHPESATTPTSWNSGTCCDPASTTSLDDVGYFNALLDELEARLCVDTNRVFAMGMSNGAYMAHTLACKMADRIAAIGPVAGLLLQSPCSPSQPMPAMLVNGTADSLSQYQYVDQGVQFWVGKNHCTTMQQSYQMGDVTCVTHGGCSDGADVVLCTVTDGGHQWPGGDALPLLGKKSDNLNATDALWTFFSAHPRAAQP